MRALSRWLAAGNITMIILAIILVTVFAYRVTGHVTPLLTVKSGSMEPILSIGDVILIEPVSRQDLKVGDVVVFYRPGTDQLIVHRIVRKTELGVYTKGDANPGIDPWSPIPYENVVGRWTGFKIPSWTGIGYLSLFLSGELYPPYGMLLLLSLIILNAVLIAKDLVKYRRESKDRSGEAESSQGSGGDSRSE